MEGKGKYLAILSIFLVATWYNIVVVPTDGLEKDKLVDFTDIDSKRRPADIDENSPEKRYDSVFNSLSGEWYRLSVEAEALDADETLVFKGVSEMGEEIDIGTFTLEYGSGLQFQEFIFQTNDVYRDIVVHKEGETEMDRWGGGEVVLSDITISRLDIASETEARNLQATILRQSESERLVAGMDEIDPKEVFLPSDAKFLEWGIFQSSGDALLSIVLSARKVIAETDEEYVVELRRYDPDTKIVDKKSIESFSFSESEAQAIVEELGFLQFNFPVSLEVDSWYALGIKDKNSKKPGGLEFAPIALREDSSGWAIVEVQPAFADEEKNRLLAGARIEDTGKYLRYEYQLNRSASDFLNIDKASENIQFDIKDRLVEGDATPGEYFVYKIDTVVPFEEMFITAKQSNTYEEQIVMEYSFDEKDWKSIPFTQPEGDSQRFSLRILPEEGGETVVYVRTRYAKDESENRSFGLDDFHVIARMSR